MSTKTASRLLLAALAAGSLLLAGCDRNGDGIDDETGQPVAVAPPADDTGSGPDCDPKGFGPLSGCGGDEAGSGGEQAAPMGKDDWPGVAEMDDMLGGVSPNGSAGWVVTKKYHADNLSCVEFRAPGAADDPFRRLCVPDEYATDKDRDWLNHQVVGQPKWTGGAS